MRNDKDLALELVVEPTIDRRQLAPGLTGAIGEFTRNSSVYAYVDERQVAVQALLESSGFQRARVFVTMKKNLTDLDERADPGRVTGTVGFAAEYDQRVRQTCNEAFTEHWGTRPWSAEDWRDSVTGNEEFLPEHSFLHVDAGVVDAFLLASRSDHADGVEFDLIGTLEEVRGRGLATHLIRCASSSARASGFTVAWLIVDSSGDSAAPALYERAGFEAVGREFVFVSRTSPETPAGRPARLSRPAGGPGPTPP
ncbi:GNAT family N-acetyltransferase [Actinoplanes sp. NPDC049265]|uniref:GNAT family N-acetyltransferase n=1 Tax=Actinoplanes sp. NPDC049265 TaxID=3363902 RepID=UPI003717232D